MLQNQFLNILKEPQSIENIHISELEILIQEYPFFETAHLLYVKGLNKYNSINYAKQLRQTAIVANNRSVLYELLHSKEVIINNHVTNQEKALTNQNDLREEKLEVNKVPENTNNITVTNNEVKVIYINTVPTTALSLEKKSEEVIEPSIKNEIDIVKNIENETNEHSYSFNEEKLNQEIEAEISKGIVQSYVETDIINTPALEKDENKEPVSFTDWLNKIKKESSTIQIETKNSKTSISETTQKQQVVNEKRNNETEPIKTEKKKSFFDQNKQILDKIIESDPGRIKLSSNRFFTPTEDAKQSLLENEHLVTETLAKIYALQGNISKAIRAYEILSLKFPQKSVYFASLIEKLKTNK